MSARTVLLGSQSNTHQNRVMKKKKSPSNRFRHLFSSSRRCLTASLSCPNRSPTNSKYSTKSSGHTLITSSSGTTKSSLNSSQNQSVNQSTKDLKPSISNCSSKVRRCVDALLGLTRCSRCSWKKSSRRLARLRTLLRNTARKLFVFGRKFESRSGQESKGNNHSYISAHLQLTSALSRKSQRLSPSRP